jgi:hypothetical protein
MTSDELQRKARQILDGALKDAPSGVRVVPMDEDTGFYQNVRRRISDHKFAVLAEGDDMLVFFDRKGQFLGWRDDGRKGVAIESPVVGQELFRAVAQELELPPTAALSRAVPRYLPPVGWTHEAIIFLKPAPAPEEVLRVWVSPQTLRVIQCLYGPEGQGVMP